MKRSFDIAKNLYPGLTVEQFNDAIAQYEEGSSIDVSKLDEVANDNTAMLNLIFAPDPITGNPRSDFAYMLKGADPGLQQFIKDHFMMPQPITRGFDNPDDAIEFTRTSIVSEDDYRARLESYLSNEMAADAAVEK